MDGRIVGEGSGGAGGARLWTSLLVLLVGLGCSDVVTDPDPDEPSEVGDAAMATPAGGALDLLDGAVTMELPAGAVADDVTITVEAVTSGTPPNGVPGGIYRFGPAGLEFDEPVVLTVRYPADALPDGVDPAWLRLFDFTSGTPELLLGSLHDEAGATVSAEIEHFSDYGAGEATSDAVVEAINRLFSRIDEGPEMVLDRFLESMERDIALTEPVLEAACRKTDVLAEKLVITAQLVDFEVIKDRLGIGEAIAEWCGGILDDEASSLILFPERSWMAPESTEQFTGTLVGPGGQVLKGPIRWGTDEPAVLSVDSTGFVTAVGQGVATLIAASPELPGAFLNSMYIAVFDELEVVVEPSPVEVAFNGFLDVQAVVLNAATREEQDGVAPVLRILDTDVADFGVGPWETGVQRVRGQSAGTTQLEACARILDPGVDTDFCTSTAVTVLPTVSGQWTFEESLEVDVDPPATETCTTDGTAQISQIGRTYFGTTSATVTCTYDPMDGSEPEVAEMVVTGDLRNGVITGEGFYHEIFYTDEACRSSGTLVRGGEFDDNTFYAGSGTTECQDDLDFYSVGPLSFIRPGYEAGPMRPEG